MKRLSLVVAMILLVITVLPAKAAATSTSELKLMAGEEGFAELKLGLSDHFDFVSDYQNNDDGQFRMGFVYRPSDRIAFNVGANYNLDSEDANGYGGFEWSLPFGNNLRLTGFYSYGYEGDEWIRYETALRILMYDNLYLYAGVRNDLGDGAEDYDYNLDHEALVFLRGDASWQWKRLSVHLRPLLHVDGSYFHDYDLKYSCSDRTALVLNMSSLYDEDIKYRLGLEMKF